MEKRSPGRGDWLYGRRPVVEALRAGKRRFFDLRIGENARDFSSEGELEEIRELARQNGVSCHASPRKAFSELLGSVNHQGVALSASSFPYTPIEDMLLAVEEDGNATVLILDHLEDPQNLGSLLRSADGAGVCGVVIPQDRSSGVTPAAVRASAGAAEHIPVAKVVNLPRTMELLKERGLWITGLDFGPDAKDFRELDYKGRTGLVIGNEGRGISRLVRENCDFIACLPMMGSVSSLNASVAGALVMYEVLRQKGN